MIRKSVKELSKLFGSVEQAVEKNQDIIHEIRKSNKGTSNNNNSLVQQMVEEEKKKKDEEKKTRI